jgi:hypothetical protein
MIWIQSSEEDLTTNMVIDWLNYYGESWIRTNEQQIGIEECSIGVKNGIILSAYKTDGSKQFIDLSKITAYWYRRGEMFFYRGKNDNEEDYLREYRNLGMGWLHCHIGRNLAARTYIKLVKSKIRNQWGKAFLSLIPIIK